MTWDDHTTSPRKLTMAQGPSQGEIFRFDGQFMDDLLLKTGTVSIALRNYWRQRVCQLS